MAANGKFTIAILAICLVFVTMTEGMSLARIGTELRCQCIKTESRFIHPKHIQTVELIQSGAHCANAEVIAILKSGHGVCLDPSAKWVERIIKRILERLSTVDRPLPNLALTATAEFQTPAMKMVTPAMKMATLAMKIAMPAMKMVTPEKRLTAASRGVPIKEGSQPRINSFFANIFALIFIMLIT